MTTSAPIKVAILWHMHQPNYREPGSDRLAMPWVRFHALKDYLDMPLLAAEFPNVKTTFNLVPSLLDQLELYQNGGVDRHLELSRLKPEDLNPSLKLEILDSFFSAFPENMIKPYSRYWELYNKARRSDGQKNILPALFSSVEMRDLQVWSNLVWIDPMFRQEEPLKTLFEKKKQFTEAEKEALLQWEIEYLHRIIPTYKRLMNEGRIEISFTPYYHPILPLLCDTNSALEASPGMRLPDKRFQHPEDADKQVAMAVDKFRALFGREMTGMWPSEGSVSEQVLDILHSRGIQWAASDEEILHHSLTKGGQTKISSPPHHVYEYRNGLRLFFRDHGLSDRIGFVYSGWKPERAVADFVNHLKLIRSALANELKDAVVPVILDGENCWEYYPNDGVEFLTLFYQTLGEDPEIELVTMSEAATKVTPRPLRSLFAGSWINHNFRIWIGHPEDNQAWDLLTRTRDTLERFAVEHPDFDKSKIARAWNQVFIAEGSDWCWWYGDEHHSPDRDQFDKIFRRHLVAVYELLGLEIPIDLLKPIIGGSVETYTVLPEAMVTASIDGRISHFYEWTGAGQFDCLKAGGAMHRVDRLIQRVWFAYDREQFYIRLDFADKKRLHLLTKPKLLVHLFTPGPLVMEVTGDKTGFSRGSAEAVKYACDDIMEIQISRPAIWPNGFGPLGFCVSLFEQEQRLEIWPEIEPIQLEIAEVNKETFWPL
ncbi:MAG: glycoside hydrolase family 57 protein [Candidatus Zixiibacteriota bacterium]